jgi:non-specific serine/threonine protein kinase
LALAELSDPLAPHIGVTLWTVVPNSIRALRAIVLGDGRAAEELLGPVIDYHEQHAYDWPRAWVLGMLAQAALIRGDHTLALERYQASLRGFSEHGDVYAILDGLVAIAGQAVAFGQTETAAQLLGAVAAVRPSVGNRVTWAVATEEEVHATVASHLGDERFSASFAAGRAILLGDAVAMAFAIRPETVSAVAPAGENVPFGLSPREIEVLKLLALGKSNQQIGDTLYVSPRTAGTHVANILGKMGVGTRSAAVAQALTARIV